MLTNFVTLHPGIRIAYDVAGSGPAIMLLHGLGQNRQHWHKAGYVRRLQADFTVIAADIRGSGESTPLTEAYDYDINVICSELLAVADACHARPFALWGYSFGGNIARYLAAQSSRVTALVVVGIPLFGQAVQARFDHFIRDFEAKWRPLVQAFHRGETGGMPAKERKPIANGQIASYLACFEAMRAWPAVEPSDLGCPCLLVVGDRNDLAYAWVQANRSVLDQSQVQVAVLKGLNHQQEFGGLTKILPSLVALGR